jgi:hypothetical protein
MSEAGTSSPRTCPRWFFLAIVALLVFLAASLYLAQPMSATVLARSITVEGLAKAFPPRGNTLDLADEIAMISIDDVPKYGTPEVHGRFEVSFRLPAKPACNLLELSAARGDTPTSIRVMVGLSSTSGSVGACDWELIVGGPAQRAASTPLTARQRIGLLYDAKTTSGSSRVLTRAKATSISSRQLVEDVRPFNTGDPSGREVCLGTSIELAADPLDIDQVKLVSAAGQEPAIFVRTLAASYTKVASQENPSCLRYHDLTRYLRLGTLLASAISALGTILAAICAFFPTWLRKGGTP